MLRSFMRQRRVCMHALSAVLLATLIPFSEALATLPSISVNSDITGTVTDSASGQPLASAEVSVSQGSQIIFNASTDAFGRYTAHNLAPGDYTVTARFIGFRAGSQHVTIAEAAGDMRLDFKLQATTVTLQAVTISAAVPLAIDTRTGDQRFRQDQYHGAP